MSSVAISGEVVRPGWFDRHPLSVAWDLIGAEITVGEMGASASGRIVEVEAYAGLHDLAAHSGRLRAARDVLFGPPARLYVYRSYGIHTMLNIVAHQHGEAGAVLIRACEPIAGESVIAARRRTARRDWLRGPGALCQGLGLRLDDNRLELAISDRVHLAVRAPHQSLAIGPRIGISRSMTAPWRIFLPDSPFVSRTRTGCITDRGTLDDHFFADHDVIP